MIILTLKGADVYLAGEIERAIIPGLSKIYRVSENELIVHATDGYLYHDGMDQTSFNLLVKVECAEKYENFENDSANYILKVMSNYAVHTRVYFTYFKNDSMYERINEEYPLFVNSSNVVDFEQENEADVEVYDGNIFEEYEDVLPVDED